MPAPGPESDARELPPPQRIADTNAAFGQFLGVGPEDVALVRRYREVLREGGAEFASVFYTYLFAYSVTAAPLRAYEAQGGHVPDLVRTQLAHLNALLEADTGAASAARLAHIGAVHERAGIEPVWVMGAYVLYWNHLRHLAATHGAIAPSERAPLEQAIMKLLFRDMGLMLEGYWDTAVQSLAAERDKVQGLQRQVQSLLGNLPQLLWSVDVRTNLPIYVSPGTRAICNLDVDMPIPCLGWTLPEDREAVRSAWARALAGETVQVEGRVRSPEGEVRWFRRTFQPYVETDGAVTRVDGIMEDATDARNATDHLRRLATTDSLTGLHNRTLFHDRMGQALAQAQRHGGGVVLMLMDLNHFKEINDTLGHSAGDEMLQAVARRLRGRMREADTLARLGGDEFAVMFPAHDDPRREALVVANHLLDCFAAPFSYQRQDLYLGAALGIALFPDHGDSANALMSRADVAMYVAKHRDSGFSFYDAATDPHTPARLQLSSELRRALEQGEFTLYYQPKVDLAHGHVVGVEALIRWMHPQQGLIEPDRFIPLAERTGFINAITDWVITESLAQARRWQASGRPLRIAINISGRTFRQVNLAEWVERWADELGAAASQIEFEITENALVADIERGSHVLDRLGELGITISIDDYGTGQSSLAHLKKLPLHTLKIDKSFVIGMVRDDNDAVIVRSTIDLAHNLGMGVVAEGVEDRDTLDLLSILGCDQAQGYFLGRPMSAPSLERWFRDSEWGGRS